LAGAERGSDCGRPGDRLAAAVAALDEEIAEQALSTVEVRYELGVDSQPAPPSQAHHAATRRDAASAGAASLARLDEDGVTLWTANQDPQWLRYRLSRLLGVSLGRVRLVTPAVAAIAGSTVDDTALDLCSVLLAKKTGHPVLMEYSRKQMRRHDVDAARTAGVMPRV
jgi:CO/xanthine dehydrogenase Mo-binding subunit